MHMHSVDYVVKRCPFVCLSVTLQLVQYCVKTAERIIKLFHYLFSTMYLVAQSF